MTREANDLNQSSLKFLSHVDQFLKVQLEAAIRGLGPQSVIRATSVLIEKLEEISFENSEFELAKTRMISLLRQPEALTGLPQFADLPSDGQDLRKRLNEERLKVGSPSFTPYLREFEFTSFDGSGVSLGTSPRSWLKENDLKLSFDVDPQQFKEEIFRATGFDFSQHVHRFEKSVNGDFFMGSLNCENVHIIGHAEPDSLFRLSLLAHEIGHSTTAREPTFPEKVLAMSQKNDSILIANEIESYAYELFFMRFLDRFLGGKYRPAEIEDFQRRLKKRKAIQFNLHLLANHLNLKFFSGMNLDEIALLFQSKIREISPQFEFTAQDQWVEYASLAIPVSKVCYLRAYKKIFREHRERQV